MAFDPARLKKQATIAATVAGLILFAIGILAFALALRPCRYAFQPGEVVAYKLTTTTSELGADGKPGPARVEVRELQLVCTGPDNEVALICPAADGSARRDQVTLLDLTPDGIASRLDAAARPTDQGVAVGFFDFNLMPLPEGSEQPRDVTINYAVLPGARNPVQGKVRRTKAGAKPTFKLTLQSSVEWRGPDQRWQQIRDLVSTYRFNAAKGLVEEATIKLIAGVESEQVRRFQVEIQLALDGSPSRTDEDPHRLREAVLRSAEAQDLLRRNEREGATAAAERLRTAEIAMPQLRALADRLCDAILHPQPEAPRSYVIRVARGPARERAQAETLARRLIAGGFPAGLRTIGDHELEVLVGPYQNPDPMVLGSIAKGFPQFSPTWVEQ